MKIFKENGVVCQKFKPMKNILFITTFLLGGLVSSFAQKAPLTDYVGKFNFPEGSVVPWVVVKITQDSVLVSESPQGNATLIHIEGDMFSVVEHNGVAEFRRNGDGKVNGVKVTVGDMVLEGTKEESGFQQLFRNFWLILR